ncbi:MAG: helix-turn-helix domain-containing protein [Nanoarchaeota archaeon]|nr:helix-turn-helix domain-containing protein [Nanoarchaeota archaeon]
MSKKYIMVSMDDERAGKIAEILGNKSSKKILDFLSEKNEASEKEIADKLKMPINTVEYNLNKLLHVELIEKTKNFFWSQKGKKIPMYKLSNKSIIISPKKRISPVIKSFLSIAIISTILALITRQLTITKELTADKISQEIVAGASSLAAEAQNVFTLAQVPIWIWVWLGTVIALVIFAIVNARSNK